MIGDGELFFVVFVALCIYECTDAVRPFDVLLQRTARGWKIAFPPDTYRALGKYLLFYPPTRWAMPEFAVSWLRGPADVAQGQGETTDRAGAPLLRPLLPPLCSLAVSLLILMPLAAVLLGASNLLLAVIAAIYGSALWLGWQIAAQARVKPAARAALRGLAIEILLCPVFGLGAVRKTSRLLLSSADPLHDWRAQFDRDELERLRAGVLSRLLALESVAEDVRSDEQSAWRVRLAATRHYFEALPHAAQ